jgi:hypothetical protein
LFLVSFLLESILVSVVLLPVLLLSVTLSVFVLSVDVSVSLFSVLLLTVPVLLFCYRSCSSVSGPRLCSLVVSYCLRSSFGYR